VSMVGVVALFFRHYTKTLWLNEDLPSEMQRNLYTSNAR